VLAAQTGREDLVEALSDRGAWIDLIVASALLDPKPVTEQLDRGEPTASPNGLTALHACAGSHIWTISDEHQASQLSVLRLLIEAGAEIDAEAHLGRPFTPLGSCCQTGGSIPTVEALTKTGATPNHPHALRSALRHFKGRKSADNPLADALVACGCDVETIIDDLSRTCLHAYSHHEEIQALRWLLNNGAAVTARMVDGRTPLNLAPDRNNHTTVVKMLIEHRTDVTEVDDLGKTPLDYAVENYKTRVVDYLRNLG